MAKQKLQKRDASATIRATQAVEMRAAGKPYKEIAEQLGYNNTGTAYNAVMRELERHTKQSVEHYRAEELERLDAMHRAVWPMVVFEADEMEDYDKDGITKKRKKKINLFAVDRLITIMERRAKLLGLDVKPDQAQLAGKVLIREYGINMEAV